MSETRERLAVLKALRPVTAEEDGWPEQARDAGLRQVLARVEQPDPSAVRAAAVIKGRSTPRRLVLAGGLLTAVAVVAAVVPMLHATPTYAATPPMLQYVTVAAQQGPADVLSELAARSRAQTQPAGTGHYNYIHTKGWYLHTASDTKNRILDWGTAELDRQLWLASDGSGRLRQVAPHDDGAMINPDRVLRPGEFDGRFQPANATVDAVQSRFGHPRTAAGWVATIDDMWNQQVVSPALQAQMLTLLATQPDVSLLGDTTDRVGRPGVALSVIDDTHGPRERLILVLDPNTGALLDSETVVLEDSEMPVQPPATIAYTVWVSTGFTSTTTTQP